MGWDDDFDLNSVFTDPLGGDLTFSLEGNNNPNVVDESLDGLKIYIANNE